MNDLPDPPRGKTADDGTARTRERADPPGRPGDPQAPHAEADALQAEADALHAAGKLGAAVEAYRRLVALDPGRSTAWWGLACAQDRLSDHPGAAESFRRLLVLDPRHGQALTNLGRSLFELGDADGAIAAFRRAVPNLPAGLARVPLVDAARVIPGSPRASHAEMLAVRRAWARTLPRTRTRPPRVAPPRGRRVRLGYVSAFFAARNWMKPVWGLLRRHDRDRFDVHLISDRAAPDPDSGYVGDPRDAFHDISGLSNEQVADLVRQLGIDVLVDLNAYSRPARLAVFLLRPAPVQVAWFNMYATSGMDGAFDALVGDAHVVLPKEERFYSERVVRVEGSYLTFEVPYAVPDVAPAPSLAGRELTFGCLGPQYKVTPAVVASWSRILAGSPGARLFLKNTLLGSDAGRDWIMAAFASYGVPADRLVLEGPEEHYAFLHGYRHVDVALDTFPYNGGTTTMEALWQGVPVLTFTGDRWASRISASLLREAGLGDWIAADRTQYEARARALAADPDAPRRLDALRQSMRTTLREASLCDVERFTRRMETIYLRLLQR